MVGFGGNIWYAREIEEREHGRFWREHLVRERDRREGTWKVLAGTSAEKASLGTRSRRRKKMRIFLDCIYLAQNND